MNDLPRLKDEDGLLGDLLRSADDDAPTAGSRRAIGAALGLAPVVGSGAVVLHASKASVAIAKVSVGITFKVVAVVAVIGTGLVVHHAATRTPVVAVVAPRTEVAPPPRTVARSIEHVMATPDSSGPTVAPVPIVAAVPPRVIASPPRHASPAAVPPEPASPDPDAIVAIEPNPAPLAPAESAAPLRSDPMLSAEVAALEIAVAALHRHDARAALAALDAYELHFPAGALAPEALAARVEATVAAGDRARAHLLAARFLADHPTSPLARRVRDLVNPP